MGQVVYRWAAWLLFKGSCLKCCTEGRCGQWAAGQVTSTPYNWTDRGSVSSRVTGWSWEIEFSLITKMVDHCARGWGQVYGAKCHLREGSDCRGTAVPCEGWGGVLISQLSSPRNTSYWGSRKARPRGCIKCKW